MNLDKIDLAALDRDLQEFARQQRERGWFKRNWLWFVPCLLLAIVVVAAGALYWALFLRVYNLDACQAAMRTIAADKGLQQTLGQPIETVKWPSRQAAPNARVEQDEIDLLWNIEGPKGQAKAHLLKRRRLGQWETVLLEVTPAGGKKVSLQNDIDGGDVAPPFHNGKPEGKKPGEKKPESGGPAPEVNLPAIPDEPPADGK